MRSSKSKLGSLLESRSYWAAEGNSSFFNVDGINRSTLGIFRMRSISLSAAGPDSERREGNQMKQIVWIGVLFVGLVSCGSGSQLTKTTTAPQEEAALPSAPNFELSALAGGVINSKDLYGKVVIVDFWATWCPPCIEEIPHYNALHAEQNGDEFVMLGITVHSGSFDDVQPYIEEFGIQYPVIMGDVSVVEGFGGLGGSPHSLDRKSASLSCIPTASN